MELKMLGKPIETLLVEDNPGEVRLTQEALRDGKMQNNSPDIILLDLNLPKISGLLL
jgi:CheY-like chemotaxis protein